uniref:Stereocilin LRR domain-containing protein n=1 Tax=Oncorhynchus tshawytscha TaxID=74940 RepID=A0A8C8EZE9_ONCTS
MPRESIRTLVMSAEKDAVKRFLSHMHQSWDQPLSPPLSQRELQAMETMTSAFIHKFPRVTPDLFVDLSQFIPFMSVSDIMSFPSSLMVNTSVIVLTGSVLYHRLMAIRDHSTEMKSPQKQAFVKRLLQSSVVGDVPSWPPYFLSSILPLLPHLPVSQFQQLTSDQRLSQYPVSLGFPHLDYKCNAVYQIQFIHPIIYLVFRDLGHIAGGMSCDWLKLWTNETDFSELLQFVSELPGGVRPALVRNHKQPTWYPSLPVPSCGDIRGTFPSAWTANQLSRMAGEELRQCVEVIGQDASLSPEQRRALWVKLRQSYSPVRGLRPEQVLGLGCLVTELGERELQDINLTDLGVLAYLGALTDWSPKKMRAAVVGVMRKQKLKVEQLGAVEVASLGHLLCGFTLPNESSCYMTDSMAALFLRELALPCSEQQMEALTVRLSSPQAFGPVSTWGPEVFTEIGTLAAGLEDMVLSALVQEQMEGLIPDAIALIPPTKMAVVFSAVQLSWLNVEQAWVVTEKQWAELNSGQRHALGLAQYEGDVLLEHRVHNNYWSIPKFNLNVLIYS